MRIKATLLMLLGILACCQAQLKVSLQFPSAAPREVFVAGELPKIPPATSTKAGGVSLDFDIPSFGGNDRIYVWDHTSNNIASKPIKEITGGSWVLKDSDFNLVGTITVHVEHKGLPVEAAKVSLSSKGKTDEKLLDPTLKGDVQFFGYPAGDLHVKVSYNTTDKKEGSSEQIFPVAAKRDKPEPVLSVAIADDVATVAESPASQPNAAQGAPQQGKPAASQGEEASSPGKFIIMLLALVAIGGLAFWLYHMSKNKPKELEDLMQKIGVQMPTQQDPNAAAPIPVAPLPPAPSAPKIMLDDAEPTPLGAPTAVVATPIATGGEPTLVSEGGARTTLAAGETLVGREEGLGVSLVGESTVSRRHASIVRSGNSAVLKDLGSTNGTFVNGTRLQGETTLKPGDQVQFGSVRFRYEG
ncbi:MAG TPA: FHA domain-containing protein [Fimbriimonadaceae bacterium]|nr:FHA domain-containing protein [Fimbriimonadaceae bacterium]